MSLPKKRYASPASCNRSKANDRTESRSANRCSPPIATIFTSDLSTSDESMSATASLGNIARPADRLGCGEGESADEDAKRAVATTLVSREQVVTPSDGRLHRLLTRREITQSTVLEREPSRVARRSASRPSSGNPRGGEFERKRNAIEPTADLDDIR